MISKQVGDLPPFLIHSIQQWCPTLIIDPLEIRSGIDQHFNDLDSIPNNSKRQRCFVIVAFDIHLGTAIEECANHLGIPFGYCSHDGRTTIRITFVDVDPVRDQVFYDRAVGSP